MKLDQALLVQVNNNLFLHGGDFLLEVPIAKPQHDIIIVSVEIQETVREIREQIEYHA